jgi:acetamidase/formamidase
MIDYLQQTHGLSRADAYMLCSVAVDLKINEIVDLPNWIVGAYLPTSIFER